jgi:hypothetical protein
MSTTFIPDCEIISPPGTQLLASSVNLNIGNISFLNNRGTNPLPPLVQANFDTYNNIAVSVVFFLSDDIVLGSNDIIGVTWDNNVLSPSIYISYCYSNKPSKTFKAYQVNFTLASAQLLQTKPETIQVFVWDKDPVTSRGTETSVQPTS